MPIATIRIRSPRGIIDGRAVGSAAQRLQRPAGALENGRTSIERV
jgi:hypothetical protein